jgi:hypothetical protein
VTREDDDDNDDGDDNNNKCSNVYFEVPDAELLTNPPYEYSQSWIKLWCLELAVNF